MPIGNVSRETAPKRETFRPPWVKEKDTEAPPAWMQKKLKPVESTTKSVDGDNSPAPIAKPLKRKYYIICCSLLFVYINLTVYNKVIHVLV